MLHCFEKHFDLCTAAISAVCSFAIVELLLLITASCCQGQTWCFMWLLGQAQAPDSRIEMKVLLMVFCLIQDQLFLTVSNEVNT